MTRYSGNRRRMRRVIASLFSAAKVPDVAATDLVFLRGNGHRNSQLRGARYTVFESPQRRISE